MIRKINNFTYKSFKNYTGPDDDFRNINVIFGYNGSGKTALVEGIKEEFLKTNDINDLRIFTLEYVSKSLLLDETNREKLKGIKATFGEVDVGLEKEIKLLENQIIPQKDIDSTIIKNNNLEKTIIEEIDKIFKTKKGNLNIKGKSRTLPIDEIIKEYEKDYQNALKVEPNVENIKNTIGDDSIENKIYNLETIKMPLKIVLESKFWDNLEEFQNKKFDDIEIPSSIIINWLSDGIRIHANKDKCQFCGAPIDYEKIKEKVDAYTTNIKFEVEIFFNEQVVLLTDYLKDLKLLMENENKYMVLLGEKISENLELIKDTIPFLEKTKDIFTYNTKNITSLHKINIEEFKEKINLINENIDKINNIRTNIITNENSKLEKLGTIVKGAIYLEITDSTFINEGRKELLLNNQYIFDSERKNRELSEEIRKLKSSKEVTSDFMQLVNETLKDLGITLILEIDNQDYILKTTLSTNEQLTIDDISEGEKNLLSLLFFYYEMFEDRNQQIVKNNIRLIILDDPISSMDDSNRFYVLEIVQSLMELNVEQVFVLTHVWDDFSQLIYGKKSFEPDSPYASYEIKKEQNSYLINNISKGSPYKHMFKEVYDLSQKTELSNDCDYYHMPNVIRKVFEDFLFFKTHKNLPQRSNKKHIENIFNISSTKDKRNLGTLLSVINVLSHTNTKTNEDILIAAKCLMKIIEKNDKLHYDMMKQ